MAHPSQYDNKLEVKHLQKNYEIRCHTFGWEPAMILEPVNMEYNWSKWVSIIVNACDFSVWRACTVLYSLKRDLNQTFILIADIWNLIRLVLLY